MRQIYSLRISGCLLFLIIRKFFRFTGKYSVYHDSVSENTRDNNHGTYQQKAKRIRVCQRIHDGELTRYNIGIVTYPKRSKT